MEFSGKDLFFSVILHLGLILMLTAFNPFSVAMRPSFDAVTVNLISPPPLGDPELIKGNEIPEVTIPQAIVEDEAYIPLSKPESNLEKQEIKKPKETPKPEPDRDAGYQGRVEQGDQNQKGGADVSDQLGPGSKFGSVTVDNANFNYPYFFHQAFGKIQRNWSNPVNANRELACVIYFRVIRTGTVLDPRIDKSSGVDAYDRACLRAVQAASPLPPLPADFRDDIIGIFLEFPYLPGQR